MLLLSLGGGQAAEGAPAQVEAVKVAHGVAGALVERIVSGRTVPMTVAGVDLEVFELRVSGQLVGEELLEAGPEKRVKFFEELETAGAFETDEVVRELRADVHAPPMSLQESAAGGAFLEGPFETQAQPGSVGELRTGTLGGAAGKEFESGRGEFGVNC
jgi:hypothetical protein